MDPQNYLYAWFAYTAGGVIFSLLSWRVFYRFCWFELAVLLECWLLALIFVPAEVSPEPLILAPALMVFAMDTLTIGSTAGIGALTRLVLGLGAGVVITLLIGLFRRMTRHRRIMAGH